MSRFNESLKSCNCWIPGILKVFKLITMLCCVVGFILNSLLIFQHFIESKTVTTSNLERKSKLHLPSLTICSPNGFKEKIFTVDGITLENYINNTIELNEIVNSIYIKIIPQLPITCFKYHLTQCSQLGSILTKYCGYSVRSLG